MKTIDLPNYILNLPSSLPNDREGFCMFFPSKYPLINKEYTEVVKKVAFDPQAFCDYADKQREEMIAGWEKIKAEYDSLPEKKQHELKNLVYYEQRISRLYCMKFWLVNYLLADGPLHDFYVSNIRHFVEVFVDSNIDPVVYQTEVQEIVNTLLKADYTDTYLEQAIASVELLALLRQYPHINETIYTISKNIQAANKSETQKGVKLLFKQIQELNDKKIMDFLWKPMDQAAYRKGDYPVYGFLQQMIEFEQENNMLADRQKLVDSKLKEIFALAKEKLSKDDFELFTICYKQANNLSRYKEINGVLDTVLLPFWYRELYGNIFVHLKKKYPHLKPLGSGNGNGSIMFTYFVWLLPDDLKLYVMTDDMQEWTLENC